MSDNLVGLANKEQRPNLHYPLVNPKTGITYECPENGWRYSQTTMGRLISDGRIIWPASPTGRPRLRRYQNELTEEFTGLSSLLTVGSNADGTRELMTLFDGADVLDFPKPVDLMKLIVQQGTEPQNSEIVLDFFAGSCTTAQAVLELNRDDGGNRQFIMVQLPALTGKPNFTTIAEIGKERIRRVAKRIKKNASERITKTQGEVDLGFKVFKLTESNYKPWSGIGERTPEKYAEEMKEHIDPLVKGWKEENVIYEVAVKEGLGLNSRIEPLGLKENKVKHVADPMNGLSLLICLDDLVKQSVLRGLSPSKDMLFICRESAIDDTVAANLALQCRLKTI